MQQSVILNGINQSDIVFFVCLIVHAYILTVIAEQAKI